ncbi:MAG: ATP-binding cassette domain-containing protein [Desulfuromonadia bacterium]
MSDLILLDRVTYRYDDGTVALDRCTLPIVFGEKCAILGMNGSGKTTLLMHLNGLLKPAEGRVLVEGHPLGYDRQSLRALRKRVGILFQNPDSQLFSASIREDVSFGPVNLGLPRDEVTRRVDWSLAMVGLGSIEERPVHALSFGQKKRAALAGVLAMEPEILLLDEPFAGLDPPMTRELAAILHRLSEEGRTIVVATHDIDFAVAWSDRIVVMEKGVVACRLSPDQLFDTPHLLEPHGFSPPTMPLVIDLLRVHGVKFPGGPPRSLTGLRELLSPPQ